MNSLADLSSNPKILVVDDDESIRELISLALEDDGVQVIGAPEGESALKMIPDLKPDLILLDTRMPVMDGQEFARRYREFEDHSAAIVVLTAIDDPERAAADVGADGYLSKPFDLADLSQVVSQFIQTRL